MGHFSHPMHAVHLKFSYAALTIIVHLRCRTFRMTQQNRILVGPRLHAPAA